MQFGLDEHKNRIKPLFSGQKSICPLCGSGLIGKCGEIYTWHWQHINKRDCDPWKEHETQWHRNWKNKFPEHQQEVIIENEYEKHIADVQTSSGIVIEFQNSSISTETIKTRENFYGNMIWVVNALPFKDNFILSSVVRSKLKNAERNFDADYNSLKREISDEVKRLNNRLGEIEKEKNSKLKSAESKLNDISVLKEYNLKSDTLFDLIKADIRDRKYNTLLGFFGFEAKSLIQDLFSKMNQIESQINEKKSFLNSINKLEDYCIAGINYKVVSYDNIGSPQYKCSTKAILKTTRHTLFPEIISIQTETEFTNFKYQSNLYDFAINLEERIKEEVSEINFSETEKTSTENLIKETIAKYLKNCIATYKKEYKSRLEEVDLINERYQIVLQKYNDTIHNQNEELQDLEEELSREKKQLDSKIMNENKGLYYLNWKHERTTWQVSNKPIFFDIGKDYIFQRLSGSLKKISLDDFINKYK